MKTLNSTGDLVDPDPFLERHLPGSSPSVLRLRAQVAEVNSSFNRDLIRVVLILGESGSGKNHTARVIAGHRAWLAASEGERADLRSSLNAYAGRFTEIPLPTLPDELVESELFGHRKGAFTGAVKDHKGLLAGEVDDVLLDEIGDATPAMQAKLLRVVETRRFRPLGGEIGDEDETSARLLLATHHDLGRHVREGLFREDLFWRCTEYVVMVPALREQPENIPGVIDYLLRELMPQAMYDTSSGASLRDRPALSAADLAWATGYAWPGNVRLLRHALVRWLACGGRRSLQELAIEFVAAAPPASVTSALEQGISGLVRTRLDSALSDGHAVAPSPGELVQENSEAARRAIVDWYDSRKPTPDQVQRLFPGAKPGSVTSKLSQWRNK